MHALEQTEHDAVSGAIAGEAIMTIELERAGPPPSMWRPPVFRPPVLRPPIFYLPVEPPTSTVSSFDPPAEP